MKLRISRDLLSRARICAEEVDAPLTDWAGRALRQWSAGKLGGVATRANTKDATRRGSVVTTLPGEQAAADEMRQALQAAVAYCEALRPPPFKTPLVEGVHYIVEKEET